MFVCRGNILGCHMNRYIQCTVALVCRGIRYTALSVCLSVLNWVVSLQKYKCTVELVCRGIMYIGVRMQGQNVLYDLVVSLPTYMMYCDVNTQRHKESC